MALVACLGMAVLDRVFTVPELPTGPTKLYASSFLEVGGGPASTAAAAIRRLGGEARLFARLGDDGVGDAVIAELLAERIDVGGVQRVQGAQSAWSAVAVDRHGERLILNTPGHGLDGAAPGIDGVALAGVGAVLVDMGWPAAGQQLLRSARDAGIPSVLDADVGPDLGAADLFPLADHVIFSAEGLRVRADTDDPVEGLRRMQAITAPGAVLGVTLGAQGFLWMEDDIPRALPAPEVRVVDTLGAGDVFHGAYALAMAEGRTMRDAALFANAAAALKCTRPGGRAGIPDRAEVEELLNSERRSRVRSPSP